MELNLFQVLKLSCKLYQNCTDPKGPFTQAIFVTATQCNFCCAKLQLQNRTCKPLCDFGAILAIYRRGMRYNSRNTVILSSSFTF